MAAQRDLDQLLSSPKAPQGVVDGRQLLITSQHLWLPSADLIAQDGELQALSVMFANYFAHS